MPKNRSRGNREPKKPKAAKTPAPAVSTFLRPQPPAKPPLSKGDRKQ